MTESVDLGRIFQRWEKMPLFGVRIRLRLGQRPFGYNEEAAAQAHSAGLDVVMDACMLMAHQRYQRLKLSSPSGV